MDNSPSHNNVEGTPFQILSLYETLTRIVDVFTNTFFVCLKISITCLLAPMILLLVVGWFSFLEKIAADPASLSSENLILILFTTILLTIPSVLSNGALIMVVTNYYLGKEPEFGQCLKKSWERLPTMLGAYIMALLVFVIYSASIGGGLYYLFSSREGFGPILMIFGGLTLMMYVSLRLYLWQASIMIENRKACESLRRSWSLTSNNTCYTFCTIVCVVIPTYLCTVILALILPKGIFQVFINIVTPCIYEIMRTVIYFNLRVKKEDLNALRLRRHITTNSDYSANVMDEKDYTEVQMEEGIVASDADKNGIVQ